MATQYYIKFTQINTVFKLDSGYGVSENIYPLIAIFTHTAALSLDNHRF